MNKKSRQKQYIVVGLGRFGRAIAETLCQDGAEVLGVDRRMDVVERLRDELTQTIQMDAMDRDALETLGVRDFDIVFVTMGSDIRASGTIVLLLKELGARRIIAKAHDEFHGRMLEKLGAELDIEKCIQRIKSQQAEAKELLDFSDELIAMVDEANEKLRKAINSDKPKEE